MAAGVYLLLGPENGQKDDFIDQLKEKIAAKNGEPPEEYRYYPFDADYPAIVSVLENCGLFSQHRFVVINQVHDVKKKADVEAIAGYCSKPAEDATLVMVSDNYASSIAKRLRDAVSKDNTKIFFELFEDRKRSWIIDYFKKAGMGIEMEAVNLLLELVENDTRDLKRECERLALFMDGAQTVTADKVDELIYHSKEESVFTLFDHIAARDFAGCLEVLQNLQLSGNANPAQVLGGLAWQFRRLTLMRGFLDNRFGSEEALRKAGIRGKKNGRTYIQACGNYSADEIEGILALISDYEEEFRSGSAELQEIGLQLFLYDTVAKKGRRSTFAEI